MLLLRPRGGDSHLQNVHEENNTTWTQLVEGSAYRYDPKMRTHCARNSKRFSHLYVFLQVSSCDQFWRRLCDGYNGYGLFLEKIKMSSGCRNVQNHIRTISPLQKCKCTSPKEASRLATVSNPTFAMFFQRNTRPCRAEFRRAQGAAQVETSKERGSWTPELPGISVLFPTLHGSMAASRAHDQGCWC